ncbi:hypothetical protein, partial [Herbiconiux daphne]
VARRMGKAHMKGEMVSQTQRLVSCYELDGTRYKIDGHSRTEAWKRAQLEKPETVACVIYHCETLNDVHNLYKALVSKLTAETKAESGYSARKRVGYEPTSPFGQTSFGAAYAVLGYKDEEEGLTAFLEAFKIIDSWNIQVKKSRELSVGIKAAMLKTLTDDEANARSFWAKYLQADMKVTPIWSLLTQVAQPGAGAVWSNKMYNAALTSFCSYRAAL